MAGTSTRDQLHKFDPTLFDWEEWEVLFDTHLAVEGVTDDIKKRNLLITSLDVQSFKTLISICKPKKPTESSYIELITKLRINYAKVTFPSTERIKFFAIRQVSNQSLTDYANVLRTKATTCDFPEVFYEQALITAFVGGLRDEHVRKHLMQKNLETLEATINSGKTIESVFIEGANTKTQNHSNHETFVNKIDHRKKPDAKPKSKVTCGSCGSTDHDRSNCRFRKVTCHNCKKEGHIAKVCRSKDTNKKTINSLFLMAVKHLTNDQPIEVQLKLNNIPIVSQVDTGSPITLITDEVWSSMGKPVLEPAQLQLQSFTGHSIELKGEMLVNVIYQNQSIQLPICVVSGFGHNIVGRDLIHALKLKYQSLEDITSNLSLLNVTSENEKLNNLFIRYADIFKEGLGRCKMEAHIYVKADAIPKFCKPRSLPFAYREEVEKDIDRLVSDGIIEPVDVSKWAAPIVVVPKPGGKVRLCADLSTGVNDAIEIDKYPLPKPDELFVALNGGTVFSKIDFSEAYLQVPLDEESQKILVINTHKGLFRYNRLPFGVASAPSIFQKIMDTMLSGLNGAVSYLDDIIVTGKDFMDHLNNLDKVLARIEEFGFHINKSKCSFSKKRVEYLGLIVDKDGVHTSPLKTKAIVDMPNPTNVSQLRSFLGMVNHYAKFIPKLTDRLAPLYTLLQKDVEWNWSDTCADSFSSIKKILTSPIALAHYDPTVPLILAADASNSGVGAVIYHRYSDGTEKVIAHASKTLTPAERNYAQIEKEALALVYGVQKFDQFLRGRTFTLLTDHKPLLTIFGSKKGIPTTSANRLQRWALRLMGYSYKIEYRSTHEFGQADGLSRLPVGPDEIFDSQDPIESRVVAVIQEELQSDLPLRAVQIADATRKDLDLHKVYTYVLSGWPSDVSDNIRPFYRIRNDLSTSNGCLVWGLRTIIPACFRNKLLNHLHSTHSGMGRMKADARRYFWWPSLDKDIEDLAKQCRTCSEHSNQPPKVPLQQWPVPEVPWKRIHIDFMGKFLDNYYLIVVDAHSKWLEVIVMKTITTTATVNALLLLFSHYGLCEEIVSDNGTQFTSDEFVQFCERHGIRHLRTSPGHPQSNGQAERYVETVKSAITKGTADGGTLSDVLTKFLFSYRSTPHATTNVSPAELFLKRQLRTVLDLVRPTATDVSSKTRARYQRNFDCKTRHRDFQSGDTVIVRDFRSSQNKIKWVPGILLSRIGNRNWKVQVQQQTWKRHENQIQSRQWSTDDDDVITVDSDQPLASQTNQPQQGSVTRKDPPRQTPIQPQILRRSSRVRKPVKRLIQEI
ncbi:unnamed protein product [Adineta ricciae]|uniref:RNA-directed DNA polymerase n=1 Tax=Adineta ricciae TaxID=249248 RepID=A0A815ZDQ9_ADIRI|nr:unnamed protein product [Adineta ricciae]CAF1581465.1 unnamed protein product [Adineta ricciae]